MSSDMKAGLAPLEAPELEKTPSEAEIMAVVTDIKAAGKGANHPVQQAALVAARDNVHIFSSVEDLFLIQFNFMTLVKILRGIETGYSRSTILNHPITKAHDDFGSGFETLLDVAIGIAADRDVGEFEIDVKRTLYWALVVHAGKDLLLASNTEKGTQTNLEEEIEEKNELVKKEQGEAGGKTNHRKEQDHGGNGARKRVKLS